jgi:metal-dependent amidase/aminoacylase/carboxypeptidase family protein
MDALPIVEPPDLPTKACFPGVALLWPRRPHQHAPLGAAIWRKRGDSTVVCFHFPAAEEGSAGAAAMMADGLLSASRAGGYALHNSPAGRHRGHAAGADRGGRRQV